MAAFQWGWGLDLVGLSTPYGTVPIAKHHAAGESPRQAVRSGVASSAKVIAAAAIIMISVFGSFILNGDPTIKQFGVGLSVAVLLASAMVLSLAPAMLTLFGRAVWWLPGWLSRLLPHVDIEGKTEPPAPKPVGRAMPTTDPPWIDRRERRHTHAAGEVRGSGRAGGRPAGRRRNRHAHYQIQVDGGGVDFRVAVNVLSKQHPSELLYLADESFQHPVVQELATRPDGFTPLPSTPGGLALDYIRANLFDRTKMRAVPATAPGPDNDLADKLDHFVARAAADPAARVYAFGQRWGPEQGTRDKVFGFSPGNGIHDIHMNQGNSQQFRRDDGVWQDGGLLLHYPAQQQWVAIFLAFQSQAWHTDDQTGHAIAGPEPGDPEAPDHTVRIVAALVNPVGPAPEAETVTVVNASSGDVDLTGWSILDREKRRLILDAGTLPAGDALRIRLGPPVALGNSGGLITLLDPDGLKVDGVAYTKAQAATEGRSLIF